ncbi:hypothetical protein M2352_005100 [Azospirillum fermentarium]|uniref:hypothetical protein n=1 Tax=Azospirillum fermentarium TaxID=1233114 RepID=UPI0022271ECD|nr:hypothetical protein [Azospirillum fermentarium]MCW2249440.1 hypothetical protein [Azospirillum fermentarium]
MAVFSGFPSGVRRLVLPVLALGAGVPAGGCVPMVAGPVVAVAALPEVESRTDVLAPITEGRLDPLVRYPARNVRYSLTIDEQDGSFILKTRETGDEPAAVSAPVRKAAAPAPVAAAPATATVPRPAPAETASVTVAAVPPSPTHQSDVESPLLPAAASRPAAVQPIPTSTAPAVAAPAIAAAPMVPVAQMAAASDVPPPVAPAPAAKAPVVITPAQTAPVTAPAAPAFQPAAVDAPVPTPAPAPRTVPVAPIVPGAVPAAPRSVVVTPCPSGGESWFRYTPEGYVCAAPTPAPAAAVAESARIPDRDCRTGRWVQATPGEFVCQPIGKGE